jgi:hypothetical protein
MRKTQGAVSLSTAKRAARWACGSTSDAPLRSAHMPPVRQQCSHLCMWYEHNMHKLAHTVSATSVEQLCSRRFFVRTILSPNA